MFSRISIPAYTFTVGGTSVNRKQISTTVINWSSKHDNTNVAKWPNSNYPCVWLERQCCHPSHLEQYSQHRNGNKTRYKAPANNYSKFVNTASSNLHTSEIVMKQMAVVHIPKYTTIMELKFKSHLSFNDEHEKIMFYVKCKFCCSGLRRCTKANLANFFKDSSISSNGWSLTDKKSTINIVIIIIIIIKIKSINGNTKCHFTIMYLLFLSHKLYSLV